MTTAPELTKKEINRVSKCLSGTRNEHRDRCYFFVLLYTGMRVGEPLQLTVADVYDSKTQSIKDHTVITKTKSGKPRRVYIPAQLKPYIDEYLNSKDNIDGDDALFSTTMSHRKPMSLVNATRMIKNLFVSAGLPSHSSHSCRRTTALMLRREVGLDLEVIREILGHSDLRTTQRYFASSSIEASEGISRLSF